MEYLKKPITIGIIFAALTYGYMHYNYKMQLAKNPKAKKNINIITPLIVGVLVWFIASTFMGSNNIAQVSHVQQRIEPVQSIVGGGDMINDLQNLNEGSAESIGNTLMSASYNILGRNKIQLPPVDVHIDFATFD